MIKDKIKRREKRIRSRDKSKVKRLRSRERSRDEGKGVVVFQRCEM